MAAVPSIARRSAWTWPYAARARTASRPTRLPASARLGSSTPPRTLSSVSLWQQDRSLVREHSTTATPNAANEDTRMPVTSDGELSTAPRPWPFDVRKKDPSSRKLYFLSNTAAKRSWNRFLTYVWLRDNCRCAECINQATMQRNFRIFDDMDVEPETIRESEDGLEIVWKSPRTGSHTSFYKWNFISRYLIPNSRAFPEYRWQTWGSEIAQNPPTADYAEVMATDSNQGLAKVMDSIARHGFVFVENTPFDDANHTKALLERIGPIRETHYGGFYDFIPDMAKADTAYTNIALPAHTDTTYFTDPAGLQAFHLLSHTAPADASEGQGALGGQSLLVDGYRAAEILRAEELSHFNTLQLTGLPWHASGNEGITITPEKLYPVLGVSSIPKGHMIVRWNNDDRGVLPSRGAGRRLKWYQAAAHWDEILKRPDSEFWFQLKPGRTLIFDNHRVLHGRSAFVGLRRICGGYINRDDWVSCWRNTTLSKDEIRTQVMG